MRARKGGRRGSERTERSGENLPLAGTGRWPPPRASVLTDGEEWGRGGGSQGQRNKVPWRPRRLRDGQRVSLFAGLCRMVAAMRGQEGEECAGAERDCHSSKAHGAVGHGSGSEERTLLTGTHRHDAEVRSEWIAPVRDPKSGWWYCHDSDSATARGWGSNQDGDKRWRDVRTEHCRRVGSVRCCGAELSKITRPIGRTNQRGRCGVSPQRGESRTQ